MKSNVRGAVVKSDGFVTTRDLASQIFRQLFQKDDRILVAVSGGPDSMALLALLADFRTVELHAVTVDHGLRAESFGEAKSVGDVCNKLGVPHTILSWDDVKPNSGIQQAARAARYALLCDFARANNLSCLTTAHHADDQAETILMRLTSGSGLGGLAGMQMVSERFETNALDAANPVKHIRPLLQFSKASLLLTCKAMDIPFVDDPSNANMRFERVQLRKIMESLATNGLSRERLLRLAERAALADEALDRAAEVFLSENPVFIGEQTVMLDWLRLSEEPKAIRQRVLPKILDLVSGGSFVAKLERIESLIDDIDAAFEDGKSLKRSIGHWVVSISRLGKLNIQAAPLRNRGTKA